MQHKDSEYLDEVEAELRTAVLEAMPPEERLRGLPPEERLRGLPPNERLRGVSFEELVFDLNEDQVAQLREALERRSGS